MLQNFMYRMLSDDHPVAARMSLVHTVAHNHSACIYACVCMYLKVTSHIHTRLNEKRLLIENIFSV